MPDVDGFAALERFGRRRPDLPVILLSSSEDPADVRRALAARRAGLCAEVREPADHDVGLAAGALGRGLCAAADARRRRRPRTEQADARSQALTGRQIEVLRLLARGLSNKEIGRELGLSEKTVKAHVSAIFRMLDVVNRTQAARRQGGRDWCSRRSLRRRPRPARATHAGSRRFETALGTPQDQVGPIARAQLAVRHRLVQQQAAARLASRMRSGRGVAGDQHRRDLGVEARRAAARSPSMPFSPPRRR